MVGRRLDLRGIPIEAVLLAAAGAAFVALVQTLRLFGRRWAVRRRLSMSRERGAAGEVRAEKLLRARGYAILGRQVAATYGVGVDGEDVPISLRADYLVARGGARFVAEVKTGRLAPSLATSTTRRQLLEYRVAFEVDGVLLVDAESDRVHEVVFPLPGLGPPPAPAGRRLVWLGVGVAVGALGAAWFRTGPAVSEAGAVGPPGGAKVRAR